MGLQGQHWWMDILRGIFGFLDGLVYGLIKWIMFGIFDLSSLTTNSEIFNGIYGRIYVILGIFMAFKLSFSFFQYIIDPESMTGKGDKGVTKLFTRVFIMLFALIALPSILFGSNGSQGLLSRAQNAFLPVLPRLIFGVNDFGGTSSSGGVTQTVEQSAEEMSTTVLKGFFQPLKEIDEVCGSGTYANSPPIENLDDFSNYLNITCNKTGTGFIGIGATKYYKYSYMLFISTVVGVLVAALLLGITLDIAKRLFKLIILEVIAPVPIMSLIDPKGSKDGAFGHWMKNLISTFIDIFLKLGLVYIIIVLIHLIVNAGSEGGLFTNYPAFQDDPIRTSYLTIVLILGLIFFAKEAPKFIKDSLGMKDSGGGLFDDVKTLGKAAGLVGGAAVGTAGILGSGIASGKASWLADQENGKKHNALNLAKNIGAGLVGAGAGAGTAVKALTGKNAGVGAVMKAQSERNARALAAGNAGSTWLGRRQSELSHMFTGGTTAGTLANMIAANDSTSGYLKKVTDRAASEMVKSTATSGSFKNSGGKTWDGKSFNYKTTNAAYEVAKAAGANTFTITDTSGGTHTMDMTYYEMEKGGLLTSNEADYIAQVDAGTITDVVMTDAISNAEGKTYYQYDPTTQKLSKQKVTHAQAASRSDLKGIGDQIGISSGRIKQRQVKAQANDKYSSKK